jgi:hypothetical protein
MKYRRFLITPIIVSCNIATVILTFLVRTVIAIEMLCIIYIKGETSNGRQKP